MHLTDISIRQLTHPATGQVKVRDDTLPGFGLIVGKRTKTFFVMYGTDRRTKTLGRYPDISLKDARKEARLLLATKPIKTSSMSVSAALTAYLSECERKNRTITVKEYRRMLSHLPDKPLSEITAKDMPDPTDHRIMAARVFFNWCIKNELTDRNPFAHVAVKHGERERVLTDDEISALWQYQSEPYSTIVRLLILTGQRRNQIWKIQPDWIGEDTITFPSSIMKSGRVHTIPLTDWQKQYIQKFRFNGWSKAKARMDKHTGVTNYVLHDFRRYFSTTMAKLGVPLHVTEHILDHRSTLTGVAAVYNKWSFLPQMREALDLYESHIRAIIK